MPLGVGRDLPISGGASPRAESSGTRSARAGGDREMEPPDGTGTVCGNRAHDSEYQSDLCRPLQAISRLRRNAACGCLSAPGKDGSRAERKRVRRRRSLHHRRHYGFGRNRHRRPSGGHQNSAGTPSFVSLVSGRVEPPERKGVGKAEVSRPIQEYTLADWKRLRPLTHILKSRRYDLMNRLYVRRAALGGNPLAIARMISGRNVLVTISFNDSEAIR